MKRFFRKLHLWLSIPLGILITVICLTGAMLVFRAEIEEVIYRKLIYTDKEAGEKLSLSAVVPLVEAQLDGDAVAGITVHADPRRTYSVSLASNPRTEVYVDPYSGEILGKAEGGFFSNVMQLHRWLLIKRDVGKPIVGYTTLLFVLILLSGIVICFPKNRRQLKRVFTIHLRKGWRCFWYDLHVSGGMYVVIGLLILALTGLSWSFQWYRQPFYKLFGADVSVSGGGHSPQSGNARQAFQSPGQGKKGEQAGAEQQGTRGGLGQRSRSPQKVNAIHWDKVLSAIRDENPEYKQISIRDNSATVAQNKVFGNSRASDKYTFLPSTGEITERTPYAQQDRTTQVRGWIYSIHVGSWGGLFSKILTFLIALTGAVLPITGYYLWIRRMRK